MCQAIPDVTRGISRRLLELVGSFFRVDPSCAPLRSEASAEHRIHCLCRLLLHVREDVRIEGERLADICMSQHLAHHLHRPPTREQERGVAAVGRRSCRRMRDRPARSNNG
jgi:hypothetical protein